MVEPVNTNLLAQINGANKCHGIWVKPEVAQLASSAKPQVQQTEVASSQASLAARAYAAPVLNKALPATSQEYITQLKNAGKVEGKDFEVKKDEKYVDVTEFDSQGRVLKGAAWSVVDGKEKPLGVDNFVYRGDGKILYRDARGANGKLEFHAHHYYNNEVAQDIISHDGLTFETKVEDYIKNLEAKGVKYTTQIEKDSLGRGQSHIVEEYTPDGKQTLKTVWVENTQNPELNHIYRDLYNFDGSTNTSVVLDKEKSIVVNFVK